MRVSTITFNVVRAIFKILSIPVALVLLYMLISIISGKLDASSVGDFNGLK